MLENGQAGIDCNECGHQEIANNESESELLSKSLEWTENSDPICPECNHPVTYEHYLD